MQNLLRDVSLTLLSVASQALDCVCGAFLWVGQWAWEHPGQLLGLVLGLGWLAFVVTLGLCLACSADMGDDIADMVAEDLARQRKALL